jgi:hypothetical protein
MKRERPKQASYSERHLAPPPDASYNSSSRIPENSSDYGDRGSAVRRTVSDKSGAPSNLPKNGVVGPKKVNPTSSSVAVTRVRQEPEFKSKKAASATVNSSPEGGKMIKYLSLDDIPDIDDPLSPSSKQPAPITFGSFNRGNDYDIEDDINQSNSSIRGVVNMKNVAQFPNPKHISLAPSKPLQAHNDDDIDDDDSFHSYRSNRVNPAPRGQALGPRADGNQLQHQAYVQKDRIKDSYSPVQTPDHRFSDAKSSHAPSSSSAIKSSFGNAVGQQKQSSKNVGIRRKEDDYDDFNDDADNDYDSPPKDRERDWNLPAFPADATSKVRQKASAPKQSAQPFENRGDGPSALRQFRQNPNSPAKLQSQNYVDSKPDNQYSHNRNGNHDSINSNLYSNNTAAEESSPQQKGYKPYTLQQYRQIRPKEYVEIPKIKPGMRLLYSCGRI